MVDYASLQKNGGACIYGYDNNVNQYVFYIDKATIMSTNETSNLIIPYGYYIGSRLIAVNIGRPGKIECIVQTTTAIYAITPPINGSGPIVSSMPFSSSTSTSNRLQYTQIRSLPDYILMFNYTSQQQLLMSRVEVTADDNGIRFQKQPVAVPFNFKGFLISSLYDEANQKYIAMTNVSTYLVDIPSLNTVTIPSTYGIRHAGVIHNNILYSCAFSNGIAKLDVYDLFSYSSVGVYDIDKYGSDISSAATATIDPYLNQLFFTVRFTTTTTVSLITMSLKGQHTDLYNISKIFVIPTFPFDPSSSLVYSVSAVNTGPGIQNRKLILSSRPYNYIMRYYSLCDQDCYGVGTCDQGNCIYSTPNITDIQPRYYFNGVSTHFTFTGNILVDNRTTITINNENCTISMIIPPTTIKCDLIAITNISTTDPVPIQLKIGNTIIFNDTLVYYIGCLNNCSNNGLCNITNGICSCYSEYEGDDCSQLKPTPTPPTPTPTPTNSSSPRKDDNKTNIGVIIGPIIAGVVVLAVLVSLLVYYCKRRATKKSPKTPEVKNHLSMVKIFSGGKVSEVDKF